MYATATVTVTVNIISTGSTTDSAIAQDGVPELSDFLLRDEGSPARGGR